MPDYQQGKIYTIRCRTDDTLVYVGSTIQPLAVRWGGHKVYSKIERCKNILIYRSVNNDWDNWYIELYELYPCSCKEELRKREGEIIRLIGNLNVRIEGRTHKEYHQDHKQEREEKHKQYYQDHKQELLEKKKQYYQDHKQDIAEKRKEKITCECGCIICKAALKHHLKSKKHLDLISKVQV